MKITVASMPCLSKIFASLATQITEDEPGVVEIYAVLSLSTAIDKRGCKQRTAIEIAPKTATGLSFMSDLQERPLMSFAAAKLHHFTREEQNGCWFCVDFADFFNFNQVQ